MKYTKSEPSPFIYSQHLKSGKCGGCKEVNGIMYVCGKEAYHDGWCGNWIVINKEANNDRRKQL